MTASYGHGRIIQEISIFGRVIEMRNANEATNVNKAVEEILKIFDEGKLSEEEMMDALKATEVTLGIRPPMPPHRPPMGAEDRPPMPPHIKPC
jgi:hypothetical protein